MIDDQLTFSDHIDHIESWAMFKNWAIFIWPFNSSTLYSNFIL